MTQLLKKSYSNFPKAGFITFPAKYLAICLSLFANFKQARALSSFIILPFNSWNATPRRSFSFSVYSSFVIIEFLSLFDIDVVSVITDVKFVNFFETTKLFVNFFETFLNIYFNNE